MYEKLRSHAFSALIKCIPYPKRNESISG